MVPEPTLARTLPDLLLRLLSCAKARKRGWVVHVAVKDRMEEVAGTNALQCHDDPAPFPSHRGHILLVSCICGSALTIHSLYHIRPEHHRPAMPATRFPRLPQIAEVDLAHAMLTTESLRAALTHIYGLVEADVGKCAGEVRE